MIRGLVAAAAVGCAASALRAVARTTVVYSAPGGRQLRLDACTPDGLGPFPAVILVHGGAFRAGSRRGDPRPLLAPLTHAGFAWFSIDYRLAPRYRFPSAVDDVDAAILWVRAHAGQFQVDPRRIALLGESAGGELVAMAAVNATPATRVAAVVDMYGPTDFVLQEHRLGRLGGDMIALFGNRPLDPATWSLLREASPVNFVKPGLPPFLIVHGTADPIVFYAESVELAQRLRSCGDACQLLTIPGGYHAMANWARIDPRFKDQVVGWLRARLMPRGGPVLAALRPRAPGR